MNITGNSVFGKPIPISSITRNPFAKPYHMGIKHTNPRLSFYEDPALPTPWERGCSPPTDADKNSFPNDDIERIEQISSSIIVSKSYNDLEKLLLFMQYVSGELHRISQCGFQGGAAVFLNQGGTCAAFAKALIALLRGQGIPAREASFNGIETASGHTVCDIWIENKWICADPYYGVLFAQGNQWNIENALGFHSLITGTARNWELFKVLKCPWKGQKNRTRSGNPERIEPGYLEDVYPDFENSYKKNIRTAYPVTFRAAATCFPVMADLRCQNRIELLKKDTSSTQNARFLGFGKGNGSLSIGYAYMNMLRIKTNAPGIVKVEFVFANHPLALTCLPMDNIRVVDTRTSKLSKLTYTLKVTGTDATALFYNPHTYAVLKELSVTIADPDTGAEQKYAD